MKNIVYKPIFTIVILVIVAGLFGFSQSANGYYADSYYDSYYYDSYYPSSYSPAPTVLFVANPVTIKRGESVALSWNSTDADYCVGSGGWQRNALFPSGAETLRPNVTTLYSITCNGVGGTAASKITVTVVEPAPTPIPIPYPVTAPSVNITVTPSSIVRGQAVSVSWTS